MRRRVNISLNEAKYQALTEIQKAYGFRGPCELVTSLIDLFIKRVADVDLNCGEDEQNEIDEMFKELTDYQPTPYNTPAPKQHRPRRTDYGKEPHIHKADTHR